MKEAVAEWRQARFEARNQSDSESDISVSSVGTDDLSDSADSEEEEEEEEDEEEEEETWNVKEDAVDVSAFAAATGPTSGVAEDGTAIDFFYLMFPEELIEHVVTQTNCYVQECIATQPD